MCIYQANHRFMSDSRNVVNVYIYINMYMLHTQTHTRKQNRHLYAQEPRQALWICTCMYRKSDRERERGNEVLFSFICENCDKMYVCVCIPKHTYM